MRRREFIPLLLPALAIAQNSAYNEVALQGWQITVSQKLLKEEKKLAEDALKLLDTKLKEIKQALPDDAVGKLKAVRIWLQHPEQGVSKCAAYHPSAQWLINHGYHAEMAKCVEFGNPELFIQWSKTQPSMVLHELAHAYHHQILTHSYPPIKNGYQHALTNHLYAEIRHANGKNQRAYALNNEKEFFAELTEAYFGRNDMFPFNRNELMKYDPTGFKMIKTAWNA